MPAYEYQCPTHGRTEVVKPMADAGRAEVCSRCAEATGKHYQRPGDYARYHGIAPMRRIYTPQRFIMRPSGYRLTPDDPKFGDFRREYELGEIRDDASPLTFSPGELAAWDEPPIAIEADPARDRALHQLVAQHWTEDLSDDTIRRRDLEAQHLATREPEPAA